MKKTKAQDTKTSKTSKTVKTSKRRKTVEWESEVRTTDGMTPITAVVVVVKFHTSTISESEMESWTKAVEESTKDRETVKTLNKMWARQDRNLCSSVIDKVEWRFNGKSSLMNQITEQDKEIGFVTRIVKQNKSTIYLTPLSMVHYRLFDLIIKRKGYIGRRTTPFGCFHPAFVEKDDRGMLYLDKIDWGDEDWMKFASFASDKVREGMEEFCGSLENLTLQAELGFREVYISGMNARYIERGETFWFDTITVGRK